MLRRTFFFCALVAGLAPGIFAQRPSSSPPPPSNPLAERDSPPSLRPGSTASEAEDEMKVKREIKLLQKEHEETVQHAQEAAELGEQILNSYQAGKNVSQADHKKLDKLERLVRKIRNQAGGSSGDEKPEPWKSDLESAFKGVAELSAKLRKEVEKTPRQVVSASIIEQANNLLELIQYVRKAIR